MESTHRRQPQFRSNSISGQEFHASGGYHRLKNLLYSNQNASTNATYDVHQLHNNRQYNTQANSRLLNLSGSPYQQQHLQQPHQHFIGRSPSPSHSVNSQSPSQLLSNQRENINLRYTDTSNRNHLHASLECLNSNYVDYQQQQHTQEQASQQQINLQPSYSINPQHPVHNQHYAASYILATPPANTIINQNGDQDLAAAAMGAPPQPTPTPCQQQYQPNHQPTSAMHYNINSTQQQINQQSIINRAMAHVSQSPLRRMGLNQSMLNTSSNISSSALLNHLSSSLHHPMRAGHSSLSLASSSFIVEDKLQNEIRKLHSDLRSEKEKNEALNSQLNINSGLMAAFEQSLTTLNDRLRQLTTLNEKKDNEIQELREQLNEVKKSNLSDDKVSPLSNSKQQYSYNNDRLENFDQKSPMENYDNNNTSEKDNNSDRNKLLKEIEDLKRQLTIKDRLLTDTRLEALSAAHQLEQMEAKLNGEHSSIMNNDDDLDEGVMIINHSPSDSDAVTDSAHFNETNSQMTHRENQQFDNCTTDNRAVTPTNNDISNNNHNANSNADTIEYGHNYNKNNNNNKDTNSMGDGSPVNNSNEQHSNNSSEYQLEFGKENDQLSYRSTQQYLNDNDSNSLLMDKLLISS